MVLRCVSAVMFMMGLVALKPAQAQDKQWLASVQHMYEKNQVYPRIAQTRKLTGTTVLRLKLDGFGLIQSYALETSSGSDILDKAAQNPIDQIGQFIAPPDNQPQTILLKAVWPPN